MTIFEEDVGRLGRWYGALPPLILIGFLIGLFLLAAAGQSRLGAADERMHDAQLRQQALSEFIALMRDAEAGERGYLLTGEKTYLQPYTDAVPKVEAALDRIYRAYGGNDNRQIEQLRVLTGTRLGELEDTLAVFNKRSPAPALNVVRTDVGKHTMDDISQIVGVMRLADARELAAASAQWKTDFRVSRWLSAVGVMLNIALVLLATRFVYGEMRRRARQAASLREQKQELERQVGERTQELTALSTHLQGVSEQEKSALSRELHDELGGLLVAARMDLSWLQQRLPTSDPNIEQRFKRIHDSLSAGVDLKRRVVEELRPTLLDNMGLYTALRWQFKETCRRAGMACTEMIPESETKFNPDAAIGVFRIAQEALTNILKHAEAKSAQLAVGVDGANFVLRVTDDGRGIPRNRLQTSTSHGLVSMRHRIAALGGSCEVQSSPGAGTVVVASIPMHRMLLVEPMQPKALAAVGEGFRS
jgi:signal transduction histidine kinase